MRPGSTGCERGGRVTLSDNATPLVEVRNLKKWFPITRGLIFQRRIGDGTAVAGITGDGKRGETLGLVGETGCGKRTTAKLLVRLLEPTSGQILIDGDDIAQRKRADLKALHREVQMIFQDPYSS